jgi:long-chain acyl-CoA synthetase
VYNPPVDFWPAAAEDLVERELAHATVRVYAGQAETIVEALDRAADERPGAPAIAEVGSRALTHGELREQTERLAGGLQQRFGVEPGDRIALLAANSVDFVLALVATLRTGSVAVLLNTRDATAELGRNLGQSGARALISEDEFRPKAERFAPEQVVLTSELTRLQAELSPPAIRAEDPALLMYTSGTTGYSKGALQSHLNVVTAAETFVRCLGLGPDDHTVVAVPLFYVTGWHGQLFPVLSAGGSGTILPRFDAGALAELLADAAATFFHAAPTIYVMTLAEGAGRRASSLRVCVAGGSLVTRGLVADTQAFAPGVDFRISYGMTETSSPAVLTPPGWIERRPGDAVGVAIPADDVRVDEAGEIIFRGATVIAGYDRDPHKSERSFTDGWLRSGDLGSIDADGFVAVHDRLKDVVNRGAEKIASLEVEAVLEEHPAVREAAVVPKPDDVYGEVPRAVVVADGVSAEELTEFARERLAKFKVPVEIEFIGELPRNPGGKVLKQQLREAGSSR